MKFHLYKDAKPTKERTYKCVLIEKIGDLAVHSDWLLEWHNEERGTEKWEGPGFYRCREFYDEILERVEPYGWFE